MNIKQTKLQSPQAAYSKASESPKGSKSESNSEAKPLTTDTFSFSGLDISKHDAKYILGYTALGAIGGAIGGHYGGGVLSTTLMTGASSAVVSTVGTAADAMINPHPMNDAAVVAAPFTGGATGLVSGLLGVGLSSATGMNSVASGAIAGGLSQFALMSLTTLAM